MGWARLDDQFWNHAKVERLQREEGPATFAQAICLWTLALSWCCRRERDSIGLRQLRLMVPSNSKLTGAIDALVRVELWHLAGPDEWRIHDFADYLPRRAQSQVHEKSDGSLTKVRQKSERSLAEVREKSDGSSAEVRQLPPAGSFGNRDTPDPDPDPELKTLSPLGFKRAYRDLIERHTEVPFQGLPKFGSAVIEIERQLRGTGNPEAACRALIAGVEADEYARKEGFPLPLIASKVPAFIAKGAQALREQRRHEPWRPARFVPMSTYRDGVEAVQWQDNETGQAWWHGEQPPAESAGAFSAWRSRRAG